MPFTIAVGDVIELRLEGFEETTKRRWNTVRHVRCYSAPENESDEDWDILNEIAQVFFTRVGDNVFTHLSEKWEMRTCRAKRIKPTESVFSLYAGLEAGGVAEEVDEPDDCAVVSLYTNKGGRKFQGRIFQGGIPDTQQEAGVLLGTTAQDIANAWAVTLGSDLEPSDRGVYANIVWSPTHYATAPSTDAASALIQRVMCDKIVRKMSTRDIRGRDVVMGSEA